MALTWICETCGRANNGDLCPGCAEPKPFRVGLGFVTKPGDPYFGDSADVKRETPILLWFFLFVFSLSSFLGLFFPLRIAISLPVAIATCYFVFRYALVKPRMAVLLSRLRQGR